MKAVALGELLIDFSCRKNNSDGYPVMDAHPGGAPANYLSAFAKFGGKASFIGKVGSDYFGSLLTKTLTDNGINTNGIIHDDSVFTTLAFVTFNSDNDREFSFSRKPGADTCLKKEEVKLSEIDDADIFHFGTLSLSDEPSASATRMAVDYAREKGVLISFDPNLRKPLWKDLEIARKEMLWGLENADIVKISDDEVDFLFPGVSPEKAAGLIRKEFGVQLVYVTMGKKGCYYSNENAEGFVPALKGISVVDTTGAGDIFGGSADYAMLNMGIEPSLLEKEDLEEIVRFACASAGLSTSKPGGIGSVPTKEEILEVLNG